MSRSGSLARHSPVEWGIRGLLAVTAMIAGCFALTNSLGFVIRTQPRVAHILAPFDGRITAILSLDMVSSGTAIDWPAATRLAHMALRQDPTAIPAIVTLGLDAQYRADAPRAQRIFAYSERLSRRNLQTQLWAIENSVAHEDVASAVHHYDVTLRTTRDAPQMLFPVLSAAIADPDVRREMVRTLARRPHWGDSFVNYVTVNATDPGATVAFLIGLRRAGIPVSARAGALIIDALVARDKPEAAWSYYRMSHPGADRSTSRDPDFLTDGTDASLFDWSPLGENGINASIHPNAGGGVFDFIVPASIGGQLLRQVQVLPPGDYLLEGHSADIDQPVESRPYWQLSCRDGRGLGRVVMPNSTTAAGKFGGRFVVPADCPVQILTMVAQPSDAMRGVVGRIDHVRLIPAPRQAS